MKTAEIKVDYINHCGDDLSTVNAARVSFDKGSDWDWKHDPSNDDPDVGYEHFEPVLSPADVKLINYLAKHKHRSPFNHSFISVRVKAPIFVARQLVKHRFMPWNEISRRYVDSQPEFYQPEYWRKKADNVKQGSSSEEVESLGVGPGWTELNDTIVAQYLWMLEQGVCAEQARMILPQNMMTEWFWSATLGAFADMLVLRLSPYTQAETRIVAEQIRDIVQPLFPVSLTALLDNA